MMNKYSKLLLLSAFSVLGLSSVKAADSNKKYPEPIYLKDEPPLGKNAVTFARRIVMEKEAVGLEYFAQKYGESGAVEKAQELMQKDFYLKSMPKELKEKIEKNMNSENTFMSRYDLAYTPHAYSLTLFSNKRYTVSTSGYKKTFSSLGARSLPDKTDVLFGFDKTPAINPDTNAPWIDISDSEFDVIFDKERRPVSKSKEAEYLALINKIVNENFHYYVGEQFKSVPKDYPTESMLGRAVPMKVLEYDLFDMFLPKEEIEQIQNNSTLEYLSKTLGRPVYHLGDVLNKDEFTHAAIARPEGGVVRHALVTYKVYLPFHSNLNMKQLNKNRHFRIEYGQIGMLKVAFDNMSRALIGIAAEEKINLKNIKRNSTPYKKELALFIVEALFEMNHYSRNSKIVQLAINPSYETSGFMLNPTLAKALPLSTIPIQNKVASIGLILDYHEALSKAEDKKIKEEIRDANKAGILYLKTYGKPIKDSGGSSSMPYDNKKLKDDYQAFVSPDDTAIKTHSTVDANKSKLAFDLKQKSRYLRPTSLAVC